jgi:hypothetical protein
MPCSALLLLLLNYMRYSLELIFQILINSAIVASLLGEYIVFVRKVLRPVNNFIVVVKPQNLP